MKETKITRNDIIRFRNLQNCNGMIRLGMTR
jgi:hypothetical protein